MQQRIKNQEEESSNETTLSITILAAVLYLGDLAAIAQHGHGGGAGEHGGPNGIGKMNKPDSDKGMKSEKGKDASGRHDKTVSERLAHNPALSSKLQGLLPAGANIQQVASGFKNTGQFVAALHVSGNLNIPFDQLKAVKPDGRFSRIRLSPGLSPGVSQAVAPPPSAGVASPAVDSAGKS